MFLGIRQRELSGCDLPLCNSYQDARSGLYDLSQSEHDNALYELNRDFFSRLGYTKIIVEICQEFPLLRNKIDLISFLMTNKMPDVGADLFFCRDKTDKHDRALVFKILVNQFLDIKRLKTVFRREFLHASDMLDLEFGYDQSLDNENETVMRRKLIQDRYRVLWGAYVDFRLAKRFPDFEKADMAASIARVFSKLSQKEMLSILSRLEKDKWTHSGLLKVAKMVFGSNEGLVASN